MDGVEALGEVPKGSRNEYEFDPHPQRIRLDRVLCSPLHYPADRGFLLGTLAEDGDALDVLIVTYEPTFPGCVVPVRPVGMLDTQDEHGREQKILTLPALDPRFREVHDLADPPRHLLLEIERLREAWAGTAATRHGGPSAGPRNAAPRRNPRDERGQVGLIRGAGVLRTYPGLPWAGSFPAPTLGPSEPP